MRDETRVRFPAPNGGGPRTLIIEAEGCMVHVTVGLADRDGHAVTAVDVSPDDETRGGDGQGRVWKMEDARRVVCQADPRDAEPRDVEPETEGYWTLVTTGKAGENVRDFIAERITEGELSGLYTVGD